MFDAVTIIRLGMCGPAQKARTAMLWLCGIRWTPETPRTRGAAEKKQH